MKYLINNKIVGRSDLVVSEDGVLLVTDMKHLQELLLDKTIKFGIKEDAYKGKWNVLTTKLAKEADRVDILNGMIGYKPNKIK